MLLLYALWVMESNDTFTLRVRIVLTALEGRIE